MAKIMIGVDYGTYSFNAATSQITINISPEIFKLEALLLITNVTDNIIIYNFSNPLLGGTVSGNIITLTYSTVAMSNTDNLQIWYYSETTPNATLYETRVTNELIPDQLGRARVVLEGTTNNISTVSTVSTVTTVSGITTLTTLTQLENFNAFSTRPVTPSIMQIPVEVQMQKIIVT